MNPFVVDVRLALKQLACGEVANQAAVGSQELKICKLFEPCPAHLMEDAVFDFASELVHGKELEIYSAAVAVVVTNVNDPGADNRLDAKFFIKLSCERLLRALTSLDLASGKLPLQGHWLVGSPLPNEYFAVAQDKGGRHKAKGGA